MYRIYLDDVRTPTGDNWIVVRNYDEFVNKVNEIGLENIDIISLDHDLGDTAMKEYFNNECCFCGNNQIKLTGDHLVPINKTSLGLEAWGNIVPACSDCNSQKHSKDWVSFLFNVAGSLSKQRQKKIEEFIAKYQYSPDVDAIRIAVEELYEESGAIVLELIRLKTSRALARSKQMAEE